MHFWIKKESLPRLKNLRELLFLAGHQLIFGDSLLDSSYYNLFQTFIKVYKLDVSIKIESVWDTLFPANEC